MNHTDNLRIDLGGGKKKLEGFINIDIVALPTVDIVADISKGIPLPDNSVIEVRANYSLEHIPNTARVMEEIYRVCKNGAKVIIRVPYFKSTAAFKDPTHVSFFTERTFEYFDRDLVGKKVPEYNLKTNFKMRSLTYNYYTRGTRFIPFVGLLRRFLWDVVKSIVVELEVVKEGDVR